MHSLGAASADSSLDPATVNPLSAIISALLSSVAMLLPMLAVIITQLINKEPVFKNLDINFKVNRWWVIGWLLMPVLAMAVLGITLLMPGAVWSPDSEVVKTALAAIPEGLGLGGLIVITLISGLFAGLTINAVFAFGEELEHTGFVGVDCFEDYFEELEEILIMADIGVNTVIAFIDKLKKRYPDGFEIKKSMLLIKFKEGGVCGQNVSWCSAYSGQICITLHWWITAGEIQKRGNI